MSNFVQASDFESGETKISTTQYSVSELQAFIDAIEPSLLRHLLGCDLYADFIADWEADPVDSFAELRFKTIYEAFCKDDEYGIIESLGIKEMLKYIIYYLYTRGQVTSKRVTGFVKEKNDNSEAASAIDAATFSKYNEGILTYSSIQWYIEENPDAYDYDKYNGQLKQLISWI